LGTNPMVGNWEFIEWFRFATKEQRSKSERLKDSWMQLSPLTGCEAEAVLLQLLYPLAVSGGSDVGSDPMN
jgi:hypothetical protein